MSGHLRINVSVAALSEAFHGNVFLNCICTGIMVGYAHERMIRSVQPRLASDWRAGEQSPSTGMTALTIPKSYKGLKAVYDGLDIDVKNYLSKLEPLLSDGSNYEIALSYCFMKLEEGHHRALKCGLVRIHECESAKVSSELEKQHFTAEKYDYVFKNVFSISIPATASQHLSKAQDIRNKLIHGKTTTDPKRREAIYYAINYMNELGNFVKDKTGKNPYGDLRGLAGKKKLLPAKSTIWMLKGFGLGEKSDRPIA